MSIYKVIKPLRSAGVILRKTKGYRHIKAYDKTGVPPYEWKYWKMRDKLLWLFFQINHGKERGVR